MERRHSVRQAIRYVFDMPRKQKMKVYRTPIGFHDAYVAAPSQKAALEAWGSDGNLFANGSAEIVVDADLTREPLAKPGVVVKRARGTASEHLAALPKAQPRPSPRAPASDGDDAPPARRRKSPGKRHAVPSGGARLGAPDPPAKSTESKPARLGSSRRPSRAPVDKAEQALEDAQARHDAALAEIRRREADLQTERRTLEKRHEAEVSRLEEALEKARTSYGSALDAWRL